MQRLVDTLLGTEIHPFAYLLGAAAGTVLAGALITAALVLDLI